jgi:hypothetical protein
VGSNPTLSAIHKQKIVTPPYSCRRQDADGATLRPLKLRPDEDLDIVTKPGEHPEQLIDRTRR